MNPFMPFDRLGDVAEAAYKKIYMGNDEEDIHIVEYETEVSNLDDTINILKGVRINKVCDLIKERDSFIYKLSLIHISEPTRRS